MCSVELKSAFDLIQTNLPEQWLEAVIVYRSFDGATDLTERYRFASNSEWIDFDAGGFDLMDILDKHRDELYCQGLEKWTKIYLTLKKGATPEVRYGYGDPKILD